MDILQLYMQAMRACSQQHRPCSLWCCSRRSSGLGMPEKERKGRAKSKRHMNAVILLSLIPKLFEI